MLVFAAFLAVVVVAVVAAADTPNVVVSEHTVAFADGDQIFNPGTLASVTATAHNTRATAAYAEVGVYGILSPSGINGAALDWNLDTPGNSCDGSHARSAGSGQEQLFTEKKCGAFPLVNGTYYLNITSLVLTSDITGYLRVVVVQEYRVDDEMVEITTSLDPWVPYVLLAALFIAAVRAQAVGVAFVAVVALLLTAAGNPWPPAAVATFGIATAIVWAWPHMKAGIAARRGRGAE